VEFGTDGRCQNGAASWAPFMSDNGKSLTVTSSHKNSNETCDSGTGTVEIKWGTNLGANEPAGALGIRGSSQASIEFNANYFFNMSTDWTDIGAHEFGHILDFNHLDTPGCQGKTVMWHQTQPMLPASARCGDKIAVTGKYTGNNTSDGYDSVPDGGEEECYDLYLIRYRYWFDGSDWHDGGYSSYYLGHYCGPPQY
jgi:hypothetical protein